MLSCFAVNWSDLVWLGGGVEIERGFSFCRSLPSVSLFYAAERVSLMLIIRLHRDRLGPLVVFD
ncbi:MAG TPA: hypothetical protein HPP65_04915 [Gammaproteobacteria bacterium]|nr:hypothetical protein [Gammaproteobacteria bacterium]